MKTLSTVVLLPLAWVLMAVYFPLAFCTDLVEDTVDSIFEVLS